MRTALFRAYSKRFPQGSYVVAMGVLALALLCAPPTSGQEVPVNVTTYHNDNARTGRNLSEKILTPANVRPGSFGRLFTQPVDGKVYAQPLYLSNVEFGGNIGTRNAVYIATQHDSVYAFDADSNEGPSRGLLWHRTFIDPANGITAVSSQPESPPGCWGDACCCCPDITPEVGLTATPVIDPVNGILYVIDKTKEIRGEDRHFVQKLHALDVKTGDDLLPPQVIGDTICVSSSATCVPGSTFIYDDFGPTVAGGPRAEDRGPDGLIHFNALRHHLRSGLVLNDGKVYATWASHCDRRPYHGWVMSFDASTLGLTSSFVTTPGADTSQFPSWGGGIWMGGGAPAMDDEGNMYFSTGNGQTGEDPAENDYGEAVLRLTSGVSLTDFFVPFNLRTLDQQDTDLASGGVLLLPDQKEGPRHLLVTAGKEGKVYLFDRDRLGGYRNGLGCDQMPIPDSCDDVVQVLPAHTITNGGLQGTPAFYQNMVYFAGAGDFLKAFGLINGRLTPTPLVQSATRFENKGATVSVSANGDQNAIVWANRVAGESFLRLYAYDALTLGPEIYSSAEGEIIGATKFSVPTIANGKVYVGIGRSSVEDFGGLVVFGLLNSSGQTQR